MSSDQIGGFIRTLLAFGGGLLVSKGYVDEATMMTIVGAITTIVVAGWSWYAKKSEKPA